MCAGHHVQKYSRVNRHVPYETKVSRTPNVKEIAVAADLQRPHQRQR